MKLKCISSNTMEDDNGMDRCMRGCRAEPRTNWDAQNNTVCNSHIVRHLYFFLFCSSFDGLKSCIGVCVQVCWFYCIHINVSYTTLHYTTNEFIYFDSVVYLVDSTTEFIVIPCVLALVNEFASRIKTNKSNNEMHNYNEQHKQKYMKPNL